MKAKTVKIGDYEVIAIMYEENDNSFIGSIFYAKKGNVPELIFLEYGMDEDYENFNEYAKELIDTYSDSIDLKVETLSNLYETNPKASFINGQEDFPQGEEEYMY